MSEQTPEVKVNSKVVSKRKKWTIIGSLYFLLLALIVTVTLVFTLKKPNTGVFDYDNGNIEVIKAKNDKGKTCLKGVIKPDAGYEIEKITLNGKEIVLDIQEDDSQVLMLSLDFKKKSLVITFAPKVYSVVLHDGETINETLTEYTYSVGATLPTLEKDGYVFVGWFDAEVEGNKVESITTTDLNDKELYARWAANSFTVVYDGNGATTGTMENQEFSYDETKALTENAYERTGYTFKGWSEENNNVVEYENGSSVSNLVAEGQITLYACWEANTYNVVLHDGETINETLTTYKYATGTTLPTLEKTGYTFAGWFDAEVEGNKVESITTTDIGDKEVYARYTANQYTVVFEGNSNTSGTMVSQELTYDKEDVLTLNTYERTGYTFKGWSKENNNVVAYEDGALVSNLAAEGEITLYACWEANTYNVVLHDGETINETLTTYKYATGAILPTPEKEGYTFVGWFDTDVEGNKVESITATDIGDKEFYAHYTANKYTVVFDGNSNTSGTMTSQELTYDKEEALKENAYVKTGYTFKGWRTINNNNVEYANGALVSNLVAEGQITLYACWEANKDTTYTVNYWYQKLNDSEYTLSEVQKTGETDFVVDMSALETQKTGFTHKTTSPKATTISGDGSTIINIYYTRNAYNITLNQTKGFKNITITGTGVEKRDNNYVAKFEAEVQISATLMSGYTFQKWTCASNVDLKFANANLAQTTFNMPGQEITLQANAKANAYRVNFNGNGNTSGSMQREEFVYDTAKALTTNAFEKTGYTFIGWSKSTNNVAIYKDKESVKNLATSGEITLYACWRANSDTIYTVNYHIENASNSESTIQSESRTGATGTTIDVESLKVPKDGFTIEKSDQTSPTITGDGLTVVNIYYKRKIRTINFTITKGIKDVSVACDGMDNEAEFSFKAKYGSVANIKAIMAPGYSFTNWKVTLGTAKILDQNSYSTSFVVNEDATIVLNAIANKYTVRYYANKGVGKTLDQTLIYDVEENLTANTFTRAGYTFVNWNTQPDGQGQSFSDKAAVKGLAEKGVFELYAQWKANAETKYKVNYYKQQLDGQGYDLETSVRFGKTDSIVYANGLQKEFKGYQFDHASSDYITINGNESSEINLFYIRTKYKISIKLGQGIQSVSKNYEYAPFDQTIKLVAKPMPGYSFDKWVVDNDSTKLDNAYNYDASFIMPVGPVNLTAIGIANKYTVNFDSNHGVSNNVKSKTFIYDKSDYLISNPFTKTGYHFIGWNTRKEGNGVQYGEQALVKNLVTSGSITLYAQWEIDTFKISSSTNNSAVQMLSNGSSSAVVDYNKQATFAIRFNEGRYVRDEYDVIIDGVSQGPIKNYTFYNVTKPHTIRVQTKLTSFEYEHYSNGWSVTNYTGSEAALTIPDNFRGEPVLAISSNSLDSKITDLKLGRYVRTIKEKIFRDRNNLTHVSFNAYNSNFKKFADSSYLVDNNYELVIGTKNCKQIPATISRISSYAFDGVNFVNEKLSIGVRPSSLATSSTQIEISRYAFNQCNISAIEMESVNIYIDAFTNCSIRTLYIGLVSTNTHQSTNTNILQLPSSYVYSGAFKNTISKEPVSIGEVRVFDGTTLARNSFNNIHAGIVYMYSKAQCEKWRTSDIDDTGLINVRYLYKLNTGICMDGIRGQLSTFINNLNFDKTQFNNEVPDFYSPTKATLGSNTVRWEYIKKIR